MLRLVFCLALLASGCASPLREARNSFDEGRYPDAVAEFRALGTRATHLPRAQRFEYALYRGLSHLALGDSVPAQRWLTIAKREWERSPTLASVEEEGRLLSAWRAMGHMPGD